MTTLSNKAIVTGTQIAYYFICHRKLWLFSHNILMEFTSETVELGAYLHETSYKRKHKEIEFDGIKIDMYDSEHKIVHEIKKSKAMEESHVWQLKYYLYHLQLLGIEATGKIDYPLLRHTETISLANSDITKIQEMIMDISSIITQEIPSTLSQKTICRKCSYYELCYV